MTYSLDFRKQVLKSLDEGMTYKAATKLYNISPTTILKWKKRLHSKPTRNTKPYLITDEALLEDVKQYPDDYHYERARRLGCSKSGICSAMQRLNLTQKKKTLNHPKTCRQQRAKFNNQLATYQNEGYPIIYMDESGFEKHTLRPYGYALKGQRCHATHNWQVRKRTNVIGALCKKTLFAIAYFQRNINTECIYNWCKDSLIPSLKRKCVVVMDNASFHKSKRIQKLLNRHGHRLLFLPPYSPDLNPIEKKWAEVKCLRRGWAEDDLSKLFDEVSNGHNTFVVD